MKTLAKTLTHTIAACGLAAAALTPAYAAPTKPGQISTMTIAVPTADLDLGTAEGQRQLDRRVARAVRQACRVNDPKTGTRSLSRDALACLAKARTNARQQVAALVSEERRGG
jgi:UrcA family protein